MQTSVKREHEEEDEDEFEDEEEEEDGEGEGEEQGDAKGRLVIKMESDTAAPRPGSSRTAAPGSGPSTRRGRRNRKCSKVDVKAKLERSRQSARECRARKKLRYQYLEDLVTKRERAVLLLRKELHLNREICGQLDAGKVSADALKVVEDEKRRELRR